MVYYERLREIREDRGLKQKDIAAVLKTTQQYYSDYENGKRDIPIRIYIMLADYYGVTLDYLTGRTDVMERCT